MNLGKGNQDRHLRRVRERSKIAVDIVDEQNLQ